MYKDRIAVFRGVGLGILFCMIAAIMTACVTNPVEPLADRPQEPDTAVVFFRVSIADLPSAIYPTKRLWLLIDHYAGERKSNYFFWFAGMPGIEVPHDWEVVDSVKSVDTLVAAQVKPGELRFKALYVFLEQSTSATYGGTETTTTSLQLPIDHSFQIAPGSMNYLGHIVLELSSFDGARFSYKSEIVPGDAARDEQVFRTSYPELLSSTGDSFDVVVHVPPDDQPNKGGRK